MELIFLIALVTAPFDAIGVKEVWDYFNAPDAVPTEYYPPEDDE